MSITDQIAEPRDSGPAGAGEAPPVASAEISPPPLRVTDLTTADWALIVQALRRWHRSPDSHAHAQMVALADRIEGVA